MAEITTICTQQTLHSAHAWTNAFGSHECPGIELGDLRWDTAPAVDTGTFFYDPGYRDPLEQLGLAAPQTVENLSNELCVGAEPDAPVKTQDELLTALDELLDSALHDEACYIDENDTTCVCVIGKVRASLPPCGAFSQIEVQAFGDEKPHKVRGRRCERNAHPASPDRHVF